MSLTMGRRIGAAATFLLLAASAHAQEGGGKLVMMLKGECKVTIDLRPDLAPKHVEQILALARKGFYDGIVFHRVIDGFMAQRGDPTGTGTGGSELPDIPAEFSQEPFIRGTVGMARASDPNSRQQPVFHHVRGRRIPQRAVHGVGQSLRRHGMHRQDRARRAAGQSRQHRKPQDSSEEAP